LNSQSPFYGFGPFRFHTGGTLLKAGKVIKIPPKEQALLSLLLRNADQVVSHEMIESEIWPRQSISPSSVSRCVYSLRGILGGQREEYIETIPKRGYRFVKPVISADGEVATPVFARMGNVSPLAYSHFIEGLAQANRPDPASQERAVALFQEANGIEKGFPTALGAIAECRAYQAVWGFKSAPEARRLVKQAYQAALSADPNLISALCVKSWAEGVLQRRFDVALRTIDVAIEQDPTYAKAQVYRSWIMRSAGRVQACISAARAAHQIDPHSLLIRHALSWSLFCARQVKEALGIENKILKIDPGDVVAGAYAGIISAYMGRHRDGVTLCRQAYEASNRNPAIAAALSYALAESGAHDEAHRLAEDTVQRKRPYTLRPHLAMTFVSLGDPESAVRLLLEAHKSGCPWAPCALIDPRLGPVAADPRLACLRDPRPSEP